MPHSNGKRQAASHVGQARKHAMQMSEDAVAAASDFATSTVDQVREQIRDQYEAGQEKLQSILDNALDNVRERPVRVLLGAVAVGCVIGWIMKRR
jgi:ElaB/YqjD/DUF883 family membrane-anchored ribosome-binding protein